MFARPQNKTAVNLKSYYLCCCSEIVETFKNIDA
jgi:hypothetical protein